MPLLYFNYAEFREFVFSQPDERRAFTGEDKFHGFPVANAMRHFIRKKFGKSAPLCSGFAIFGMCNKSGDEFENDNESYLDLAMVSAKTSHLRWMPGCNMNYKILKEHILYCERDKFSRKSEIELV